MMDALALFEDHANGRIRRERVFRQHEAFMARDDWLIPRFRFPRAALLDLWAELGPVLDLPEPRDPGALTTLGFLATSTFQQYKCLSA